MLCCIVAPSFVRTDMPSCVTVPAAPTLKVNVLLPIPEALTFPFKDQLMVAAFMSET
jgi:hypothetical protein